MRYRDIANKILQKYWIKVIDEEKIWITNLKGLVLSDDIKKDFNLTSRQFAAIIQKIKAITDPIENLMFYGMNIRIKGKKKRAYYFADSLLTNALGIMDVVTRMKYPAERGKKRYLPEKMTRGLLKYLPESKKEIYIKLLPQAIQILDNFSNDLKISISQQLPKGVDLDMIEIKEIKKIEKCLK